MKKIRQTLWEKALLKFLSYFLVYAIVRIFCSILLKFAQISCIIIDINLLKIKKIRQTLWEQEPF